MTSSKRKRWPFYLVVGSLFFYAFHWGAKLFQLAPVSDVASDPFGFSRINWMFSNFQQKSWIDIQFTQSSLLAGLVGLIIFLAIISSRVTRPPGTYRSGEEYGSARYATIDEINSHADKEPHLNLIHSQNARMGLYNKNLSYDKHLNKNRVIIGTPGDWKTRSIAKPNIMQCNCSFLMNDPKGLSVHEVGNLLDKKQYRIRIFDLISFKNSDRFNVFRYMNDELDIDRIAESLIETLKRTDVKGEDFWSQSEIFLLRSLLAFLYFDGKVLGHYEPSLPMITDLLRELPREDPELSSPVEELFKELENSLPNNYANRQFKLFIKSLKGRTVESVQAILASRFSVLDHDVIRELISHDTMEIDKWQTEYTAVFMAVPEVDKSFRFLSNLFITTVLKVLPAEADKILQGKHPQFKGKDLIHFRYMLDEFTQLGVIPNFTESQASIRSREQSIDAYIQSRSQVKALYKEEGEETILNNSNTIIYLGGSDSDTLKKLSERTGPQTIQSMDSSRTISQQGSSSENFKGMGRELLKPDEIARIGVTESLVFVEKHFVLRDRKFDLSSHPNYQYIAEGPDDDNWYTYYRPMSDIDEWYENVKDATIVELTEADLSPEQPDWVA